MIRFLFIFYLTIHTHSSVPKRLLGGIAMTSEPAQNNVPDRLGQIVAEARRKCHLTQKDLSAKTGIAQSDISRLEQSNANPSIRTLERIAEGLAMRLQISFVPPEDK